MLLSQRRSAPRGRWVPSQAPGRSVSRHRIQPHGQALCVPLPEPDLWSRAVGLGSATAPSQVLWAHQATDGQPPRGADHKVMTGGGHWQVQNGAVPVVDGCIEGGHGGGGGRGGSGQRRSAASGAQPPHTMAGL